MKSIPFGPTSTSRKLMTCSLAAALLAAVGLAGCRDSEQNRPIRYDKGVYQGLSKEGADESTRREYRLRARHQGFSL